MIQNNAVYTNHLCTKSTRVLVVKSEGAYETAYFLDNDGNLYQFGSNRWVCLGGVRDGTKRHTRHGEPSHARSINEWVYHTRW